MQTAHAQKTHSQKIEKKLGVITAAAPAEGQETPRARAFS
jgi:hypothetical protein